MNNNVKLQRDNEVASRFNAVFKANEIIRSAKINPFMPVVNRLDRLHTTLSTHFNDTDRINKGVKACCATILREPFIKSVIQTLCAESDYELYNSICYLGSIMRAFLRYAESWGNDDDMYDMIMHAGHVVDRFRAEYEDGLRGEYLGIIDGSDWASESSADVATQDGDRIALD